MGQLTSAPFSARGFADWFLSDLSHPELSRRTLDLLISDTSQEYVDPKGNAYDIERATMANIVAAVDRWKSKGSAEKSILIFYFWCLVLVERLG